MVKNKFAALQSHANSGFAFNGGLIVEDANSTAAEQRLALYTVRQCGNTFGAPQQCATVAIITTKKLGCVA